MANVRRYRTVTVVLDEDVCFDEAQATLRAILMLRGVSEAHLNAIFTPPAYPERLGIEIDVAAQLGAVTE